MSTIEEDLAELDAALAGYGIRPAMPALARIRAALAGRDDGCHMCGRDGDEAPCVEFLCADCAQAWRADSMAHPYKRRPTADLGNAPKFHVGQRVRSKETGLVLVIESIVPPEYTVCEGPTYSADELEHLSVAEG